MNRFLIVGIAIVVAAGLYLVFRPDDTDEPSANPPPPTVATTTGAPRRRPRHRLRPDRRLRRKCGSSSAAGFRWAARAG